MVTEICTRARKNFCCSELMKPREAVAVSGSESEVVFLEFAAERAARDAELLSGQSALAASAFEGLDDHLLFHAVEIADGHGSRLTEGGGLSGERGAEFREVDLGAGRFHCQLRDQVAQFADVAGPAMREKGGDGLRRKVLAGRFETQEMFGEGDDILGALAQRRNAQLELSKAVEEVLTEAAFFDGGFEILVSGGDDADVDFNLAVTAETVEGLAIEHAQEFHLSLQLQFADFVEEESAFLGEFEKAGLRGIGAAEGAFFVSEEFAFDEVFGEGGAVDIDPGTSVAWRRLVNRARNEFLAGASLAGNQNSFGVARDAVDQCHEFVHDRAGKNKLRVVNCARDDAGVCRSLGGGISGVVANGCRNDDSDDGWRRGGRFAKQCGGELDRKTTAGLWVSKSSGIDILHVPRRQ